MPEQTIAKSLNKTYRQVSIDKQSFDSFRKQLEIFYRQISTIDTEEKIKGDLMDFLKHLWTELQCFPQWSYRLCYSSW